MAVLVLSAVVGAALAYLAVAWHAFGASVPEQFFGHAVASFVFAVIVPVAGLIVWVVRRRKLTSAGVVPASRLRSTMTMGGMIALIAVGCAVTTTLWVTAADIAPFVR